MARRATLLRLWLEAPVPGHTPRPPVPHILLRMVEDPGRAIPSLLRTHGHAVIHDGGTLTADAPATRALLRRLQEPFRPSHEGRRKAREALPPTRPDPVAAVRALRRGLRHAAPGGRAALEVGRSYWDDAPMPPWEWGRTSADGAGPPWPFHPEVIQWRLGLRRLLKGNDPRPARRRATQERLRALGLVVMDVPPGAGSGPDSFLAAGSRAEVTEALARERELRGHGPTARAAQRWMGEALGYPTCCTEAFTALHEHGDAPLRAALLPRLDEGPHTPLTQWVIPPVALVAHTPCHLGCPATTELARRTLAALEAERPGFRERWLAFGQAVTVVDAAGVGWSLQLDHPGPLRPSGRARVVAGWRVAAAGPEPVRPARELIGRTLTVGAWGLGDAGTGWRGVFAADHRGALGP